MRQRAEGPKAHGGVNHAELAGLGLTIGLATAGFAWGGNWLDGRLGTTPLFVLLGAFLGFGGGCWSMVSRLLRGQRGGWGQASGEDSERDE